MSSKKRMLNDTDALCCLPTGTSLEKTISSRKIDNGYIVRTSVYNGDTGRYTSSEVYTRDPDTKGDAYGDDATGSCGLKGTKAFLGNDI